MSTQIAIDDVIADVIETDIANGGEPSTSKVPQTAYLTTPVWPAQPWPGRLLWWLFGVILLGFLVGFLLSWQWNVPVLPGPTTMVTPTAGGAATPSPSPSPSPTPTPTPSPSPTPTSSPTIVSLPSVAPNALSGMCALVVHDALGDFPSYFDWTLYWYGFDIDEMEITMSGVNDGNAVSLPFDGRGPGFFGQLGINGLGQKQFESIIGVLPDGSLFDLTPIVIDFLGTDTLDVGASGQGFGSTCPG